MNKKENNRYCTIRADTEKDGKHNKSYLYRHATSVGNDTIPVPGGGK